MCLFSFTCNFDEQIIQIKAMSHDRSFDLDFYYNADSLEQQESQDEQQNLHVPSAIPTIQMHTSHHNTFGGMGHNNGQNYQLTFKKDKPLMFGSGLNGKEDGKNLFHYLNVNPEQSTKQQQQEYRQYVADQHNTSQNNRLVKTFQKCKSYAEIFEIAKSMDPNLGDEQQLREVLREEQIDQITYLKIQTYLSLIVLSQFRKKRNSCRLNLQVLRIKMEESKEVSEQDRRRLQLLELLKVQLDKKIFIHALKHNRLKKICVKVLSNIFEFDDQQNEQQVSMQRLDEMGKSNLAESQAKNKLETVQQAKKQKFLNKNFIAIFMQTVSYFFNKTTYFSFQILKELKNEQVVDEKAETEEQQNQMEPSFSQRQDPIEAIYSYIKELRKEMVQESTCDQDVLKNYFIKWKVFFLKNMISKIQEDEVSCPSNAKPESDEEIFTQISSKKKLKNSLKAEKRELKQFLQFSRRCEFYKHLGEMKAQKQIKQITKTYFCRNLLKKAITGLELNKSEEINRRDTEEYADYIADNQNEEEMMTASIFQNTNCLARAFFGFKNYLKCEKISRKMLFLLIKYCFHQIRFKNNNQQQNEQKVERFLERKRKMTIFKYFFAFKNFTSFSNQKLERVQNFIMKRNQEIISVCFSVLSLEWKKKLILAKKLQTFLEVSSISRFFSQCEHIRNQRFEKEAVLIQTIFQVQNMRKSYFFVNLKAKYLEGLKDRALEVKSVKLQIEKMKSFAQKGLSDWRKKVLYHKNYSLVGKKLLKVKELEKKEKIFRIWQKRLLQKIIQGRKDRKTNNHKIWLNKYLEKLHALEDQE